MLTDANGVPLVVRTTPANVNDERQLPALLDARPAVQGPRGGRPRRNPGSIVGDRAYGTAAMIAMVIAMGMFSFLAPRNEKAHGSGLGVLRYDLPPETASSGSENFPVVFQAAEARLSWAGA